MKALNLSKARERTTNHSVGILHKTKNNRVWRPHPSTCL